jgi:DNA polymerase II large subunit
MTYKLPSHLQKYFDGLNTDIAEAYEIAKLARKKGIDPDDVPEIQIAKNMAERVVGLVSVLAPQIVDSGVVDRIIKYEKEYSILDWRVAFRIALDVAKQEFCEFEDEREAMEVGIRVGFAYATNGVVSSPLEGFSSLELKDRMDGKGKYFRINYAGPIRNAGGTAASVSVLIADYVRKHMGYKTYDPTEDEVKRCYSEIGFYHERVANLQYYPSEEEMDFLCRRMPVEVAGDPSEKYDVPNYKNLPRVPTNKLRSGYCLIYSSCIPLKAPKLWKQLVKWGEEMDMGHWNFLEEFIELQHKAKAKSSTGKKDKEEDGAKIHPIYTYIKDLVAGRPVFAHPMRPGGFRLRYGRSRLSGLSGQSLHPATMIIANEFIATGSQLKVERPGKAAAYTPCDQLDAPIVKLKNGNVLKKQSA